MTSAPDIETLLHRLERAGRYPAPDLIDAIWERRAEAEPLMLTLFRNAQGDSWRSEDDPRWYRLVHAGKFLLSWRTSDALPIFADLYADDDLQDECEWFEEDLVHYGPAAIPHLQRVLEADSGGQWHYGRALCGSMLTTIAQQYPETYDTVVSIFRGILPAADVAVDPADADQMWANIAGELGQLADKGSRAQILTLAHRNLLRDGYFERRYYLRDMNRGFRPQKPGQPYDMREEYRQLYQAHQAKLRREADERQRQRARPVRQAQLRVAPKVGRNDPCPCGSGKKYKKCHGRAGA